MAHQTRLHRKQVYRVAAGRYAWRGLRKSQVRIALQALEALYRRG